ncbi:hypothetical protein GP5015_2210 [gamma proteobacterium HTCC5015]|nr:hypothetical protein GP5015_2210 [gamma proteobacterium HTCC5015]
MHTIHSNKHRGSMSSPTAQNQTSVAFQIFLDTCFEMLEQRYAADSIAIKVGFMERLVTLEAPTRLRQKLRRALLRSHFAAPTLDIVEKETASKMTQQLYEVICNVIGPIEADQILDFCIQNAKKQEAVQHYPYHQWL